MSISSSTIGGGRTKLKVIFLGDQTVGKSSIIEKYIKNKFQEALNPTIGIDFHIKNVTRNGHQYRMQLWDTAGQERFRSLIPNYMKDAHCAVMVYDVTKKSSLQNIKFWNDMYRQHQTPDAIKVLVGNKIDLTNRQVSKKDGQLQATRLECPIYEVSAKTGKKLDELFNYVIDKIVDALQNQKNLPPVLEKQDKKADQKLQSKEHLATSKFQLKQEETTKKIQNTKFCCSNN